MINRLPRLNEGYYTQIATDIPIEERVFAKEIMGVRATMDNFRIATPEEVAAWGAKKEIIETLHEENY